MTSSLEGGLGHATSKQPHLFSTFPQPITQDTSNAVTENLGKICRKFGLNGIEKAGLRKEPV